MATNAPAGAGTDETLFSLPQAGIARTVAAEHAAIGNTWPRQGRTC